jgi:hypothetical protein
MYLPVIVAAHPFLTGAEVQYEVREQSEQQRVAVVDTLDDATDLPWIADHNPVKLECYGGSVYVISSHGRILAFVEPIRYVTNK